VALGTIAAYGLVLVMATAALAGSIGRAVWFPIHSASVLVFCITLAHGATAGSDGSSLRWVYACTGLVVVGLQGSRWVIGRLARRHALADR
jgi:predicted alpha/beta-hydrolase family hydrolase